MRLNGTDDTFGEELVLWLPQRALANVTLARCESHPAHGLRAIPLHRLIAELGYSHNISLKKHIQFQTM